MSRLNIRFCGFGGQGIVLSAVLCGTAYVTRRDKHAVQTQSYGSEARGGQCQAELILSDQPILSPVDSYKDILVAMSQPAYERYRPWLKPQGLVIVDSDLVSPREDPEVCSFGLPATAMAHQLGDAIAANMVMIGVLQRITRAVSRADLVETLSQLVPKRYYELNVRAIDAGIECAGAFSVQADRYRLW